MRCVITGVAGFVGSSLADTLLAAGHEVRGIDAFIDYYPREIKERNLERARSFDTFSFIEGNLLETDLERLLDGATYIFHQAAQAGVRASWGDNFSIYTDNNILATQHLLEAARGAGVKNTLKKIVYASSSSIYGDAEALPTIESMRPSPISPYGVSKLAAEHLMVLNKKEFGVPTVSLRYFTVYGPRQRPDMAFHRFARAALEGEKITVYDDGEQSRDFTFIEDIIRANIDAATKETKDLVMNIGGGSRVTVNQVLETIADICGTKLKIDYRPRQKGDVKHTAADTSLAQKNIDYAPRIDLATGLRAEVEWMHEFLKRDGKENARIANA